jgi:thioredoxin reductase
MDQAFVSIGAGVAGLGTAAYLAYANKPAWALAAALAGLAPAAYYRLARPSAGVAINPSAPKPAA